MKKIKIRGLALSAGWIFLIWGALVALKGFWDVFWGEPEANFYSSAKWEFISKHQWLTWSGFEITYGVACIGVAYLLRKYAQYLPDYIEKNI
jgi:hypothetical protein